jgi:hypothetical protein
MKAWSPRAGEADNSSTIGSRSLAEEATTTIGNVSIQLSQKAWIWGLSGHRARAPDLLIIMLPNQSVGALANTTAALSVYASAPTHGELRHSIIAGPLHCCGPTASNRNSVAAHHFGSKQGAQPNMITNLPTNPGSAARVGVTFFALLVAVAGIASAQTAPGILPIHAQASRYGGGWDCVAGYAQQARKCIPIVIPLNGYLDASRNEWECDRGYVKAPTGCIAVKVPDNAYPEDYSFSSGWRCNRGYHQNERGCTRILVPENAYSLELATGGRGWECNRGFRLSGKTCAPVKIPSNGYLGRYGDDWQCERGFTKQSKSCVAVVVPKNAYLDASGTDWQCERGFSRKQATCIAMAVPANAYIGRSGNEWNCLNGFRRSGERCISE